MVHLSLVFATLLAGALPQLEHNLLHQALVDLAAAMLVVIWPVFWLEVLVRWIWLDRGRLTPTRIVLQLVVCIAPPLRMLVTPACSQQCIWIPRLGWARKGRRLTRRLEGLFSGPMLMITLMILPALALELLYRRDIIYWPMLGLALDVATRAIWLAFMIELVLMLAASPRKLAYAARHWLDVAIVVFPLLSFVGVLNALEIAEASRLVQMTRVYRLRALALRGWRALLLLRGLENMSLWTAEKRLAHLKTALARKQEEMDDLREHITELEERLERARSREINPPVTETPGAPGTPGSGDPGL